MTSGSNGDSLAVINVVMQGFATGTLLYVIFFEILSKDRNGMVPYISVLGGTLLMALMQYIGEYTHTQILLKTLIKFNFTVIKFYDQ
jgi:solute carrier family 39 (zinc transporter), member 1/2/3